MGEPRSVVGGSSGALPRWLLLLPAAMQLLILLLLLLVRAAASGFGLADGRMVIVVRPVR